MGYDWKDDRFSAYRVSFGVLFNSICSTLSYEQLVAVVRYPVRPTTDSDREQSNVQGVREARNKKYSGK